MNSRMKKSFEAVGVRWSRTRERGATAVVIAFCLLLVVGAAALSFDTANLALKRQALQNLTDAAAQAGAVHLRDFPTDLAGAQQAAFDYAHDADATFTLADVTLWCIVASTGATKQIAPGNIPSVCNPITYTGQVCDENLCAIPCNASGASCNAIEVNHEETVPFYFAPAIGIPSGSTGAVASVSCAKSCGSGGTPNPMDIAIVADRTPSMSNNDFDLMKAGIRDGLTVMTPEYQFVTLGTIHKSKPTTACATTLGPQVSKSGYPATYPNGGGRTGKWMPLGFSNDYLNGTLGSAGRTVKATSALVKGLDCMDHHDISTMNGYPWNTHLAAPLKAAARVLLEKDLVTPSLSSMTAARDTLTDNAPVSKWIIFETDGQPRETIGLNTGDYRDSTHASNNTSIDSAVEPSAPNDEGQGCTNLRNIAGDAKNKGVNIIMIAYGDATTAYCGSGRVRDTMAAAASPANGNQSLADKSCTGINGLQAAENTDGDYFFCAATGADLQSIFKTAIGMASSAKTKFVKMPS